MPRGALRPTCLGRRACSAPTDETEQLSDAFCGLHARAQRDHADDDRENNDGPTRQHHCLVAVDASACECDENAHQDDHRCRQRAEPLAQHKSHRDVLATHAAVAHFGPGNHQAFDRRGRGEQSEAPNDEAELDRIKRRKRVRANGDAPQVQSDEHIAHCLGDERDRDPRHARRAKGRLGGREATSGAHDHPERERADDQAHDGT